MNSSRACDTFSFLALGLWKGTAWIRPYKFAMCIGADEFSFLVPSPRGHSCFK